MGRTSMLGAARLALVPLVLAVAGCPDAGDRASTVRGTTGEEVYGIFCDRIGAQSLTEDLDGSSFRSLCHKTNGAYGNEVDESKLPPIDQSVRSADGGPVDVNAVKAARQRHIGRLKALVRRRGDIIRALDAAFPDITLASISNINDRDPEKSCLQIDPASAPDEAKLSHQLTLMLGRIQALYNDGTLPRTTQGLARIMQDLEASPEGRQALARLGSRVGYRPSADQLGLVRPAVAYGRLRDFSNAALSLLSADSQPYALDPKRDRDGRRIPVAGPAHPAFSKLLETTHEELRTYAPDTPGLLGLAQDPLLKTTILSRPRTNLELLSRVVNANDPSFATAGAAPLYVALRDDRGFAIPHQATPGVVPAPFVDDGTGQAKVDDLGRFVLADGARAPTPFDVPFAPDLADLPDVARDASGRALGADGQLVYDYVDTSASFANALLDNLPPLIKVNQADPSRSQDALLDAFAGLQILTGSRDRGDTAQRAYAPDPTLPDRWKLTHTTPPPANLGTDPVTVNYRSFHAEDAKLADFVYAVSNILATHDAQATLALVRKLAVDNEGELARLIGEALRLKGVSDASPDAMLPRTSVVWDDILAVVTQIAREPGMLEDILELLSDPTFVEAGQVFGNFTRNRDLIGYDRLDMNGPIRNITTGQVGEDPKTPVDRSKPDTGDNRSALQRFAQLVHDTNGVTACNKENAVLYAVLQDVVAGAPAGVLFPADYKYTSPGVGTGGYKACEFLKVENLAKFYLESIVQKSTIHLRQTDVKNGTANAAFLSPKNTDSATQKEGDYCGFDIAPATIGPLDLCLPGQQCCKFPNIVNFKQPADEALFATVTGISGFWSTDRTFKVKPEFVSRFGFFDFEKDTTNLVTRTSLLRTNGPDIGSRDCKEKIFKDPCAPGSGAPHQALCVGDDIAPDGNVHGFYECDDRSMTLRGRDDDTLFLGEVLGFQRKITPLLKIFSDRDKTQLFIDLMDALHRSYATSSSGISRYEPILTELFVGDLFAGLGAFEKVLAGTVTPRCTTFDATTKACTKIENVDGITLLANTTRDLLLPERAKANGLVNRDGSANAKRADGSDKGQTTSLDQLTSALSAFDNAFDDYAAAHPDDTGRKGQWRRARSALVDRFLTVTGTQATAKFQNRATPAVLPLVLDVLREELDANCPGASSPPFPTCDWAKTGLTEKLTDVTTGPLFATIVDVLDAIRNDGKARTETELLLLYLADPRSPNDARGAVQTSLVDLLQILRDDTTMTPVLHTFSGVADSTLVDEKGDTVQTSVADAATALLARLQGRAFDKDGVEVCSKEIDPNQVLPLALQNLVKPFPIDALDPDRPTQTPLELLIDVIAEVNRADPGTTTKMDAGDYDSVARNVESFLLDKQRGLEQFYEVIRLGTQEQVDR